MGEARFNGFASNICAHEADGVRLHHNPGSARTQLASPCLLITARMRCRPVTLGSTWLKLYMLACGTTAALLRTGNKLRRARAQPPGVCTSLEHSMSELYFEGANWQAEQGRSQTLVIAHITLRWSGLLLVLCCPAHTVR